jgi:hypothetical protein
MRHPSATVCAHVERGEERATPIFLRRSARAASMKASVHLSRALLPSGERLSRVSFGRRVRAYAQRLSRRGLASLCRDALSGRSGPSSHTLPSGPAAAAAAQRIWPAGHPASFGESPVENRQPATIRAVLHPHVELSTATPPTSKHALRRTTRSAQRHPRVRHGRRRLPSEVGRSAMHGLVCFVLVAVALCGRGPRHVLAGDRHPSDTSGQSANAQ